MQDPTIDRGEAAQPESPEPVWRQWMMVAVGLTALMSALAIIVSMVALGSTSSNNSGSLAANVSATPASASVATPPPTAVKLVVKTDAEHGRKGPDGVWHDAFLPADFTVKPGQTVDVTVYNYDNGPHTFTAPTLGVTQVIAAGSGGKTPRETTFKFTAPSQAGTYQWWCNDPCDPWAMAHQGYMQGAVTVRS